MPAAALQPIQGRGDGRGSESRSQGLGRDVPGYASLMVAVLLSLGLQMLALGIIGEYLGRVFQEVKRRPLYVTRKAYGFED